MSSSVTGFIPNFYSVPSLVMAQSYFSARCEDNALSNYVAGSQFQNNLNCDTKFCSPDNLDSYPDELFCLFVCRDDF